MVSASLVDANTLNQIWRNDFGGEVAGPVIDANGGQYSVSSQGDLFDISKADDAGFTRQVSKASTVMEGLRFGSTSKLANGNWVTVGNKGTSEFVSVDPSAGKVTLNELAAPSNNPAVEPIVMGDSLIVANTNGQLALVDPSTGGMNWRSVSAPCSTGQRCSLDSASENVRFGNRGRDTSRRR